LEHTGPVGQNHRHGITGHAITGDGITGDGAAAMGLNPFRQQRRRSTDYVFVAAAFAVVAVLLVWAALPR